jgi:5-formyltetrahydrofolate cyclo-ligase
MNKNDLRQILKKSRQAFSNKQLSPSASSFLLFESLAEILRNARCVAGYCATGGEPAVLDALAIAAQSGATTALPRLESKAAMMRLVLWAPGDALSQSTLGVLHPTAEAADCAPDVILTPLVGFDRHFNRLGQGAGHYDRAFARLPDALRVGIAWSVQEVAILPVDPWDMPLDAILTEKEWLVNKNGRIAAKNASAGANK